MVTGQPAGEGTGDRLVTEDLLLVGRSLLLDRAAGIAISHLDAAGVPSILLKGAAIATWLYDDGEVRSYVDVDLLVAPTRLDDAKRALAELGYVHRLTGAAPVEFGLREQELIGPDDVCIDLHHGLLGISAPAERAWEVLAGATTPLPLSSGVTVRALDIPARTMHLALHAAQNGPVDVKALADLERGLGRVGEDGWRAAADLAANLHAAEAFAAGVRLLPAGRLLADRLSLTRRMTVELALRTRSAPQRAIFFERLAEAPGISAKVALIARKLFPTAAYLRANATTETRGRLGLVGAWVRHLASEVRSLPTVGAWRRARADAKAR